MAAGVRLGSRSPSPILKPDREAHRDDAKQREQKLTVKPVPRPPPEPSEAAEENRRATGDFHGIEPQRHPPLPSGFQPVGKPKHDKCRCGRPPRPALARSVRPDPTEQKDRHSNPENGFGIVERLIPINAQWVHEIVEVDREGGWLNRRRSDLVKSSWRANSFGKPAAHSSTPVPRPSTSVTDRYREHRQRST